jgi:CHAT domain-containing protein
VGNPLPDAAAAARVQEEIRLLLPALEQAVAQARLPAGEEAPMPHLLTEALRGGWRRSLEALGRLCHLPPEEFRVSGKDLLAAAWPLFPLPEYGRRLWQAVSRIPVPLPFARAELRSVADLWASGPPPVALYEEQATLSALAGAFPGARYAHFACHGSFDPEDPAESGLRLAGEDRLTLRDLGEPRWEQALQGLRLAVLSACQTAIVDFAHLPEEAFGLPAGFLQAGAPAVVGSLWPVDDESTALLMHRFYELHLRGDPGEDIPPQPPAQALRLAQRWLRTVTSRELGEYLERYRAFKEAVAETAGRMSLQLIHWARQRIRQEKPDARPYASPDHWAGFLFLGA